MIGRYVSGGHRVHVERLPGAGVKIWLDGVRVKRLRDWVLREEAAGPPRVELTIYPTEIVWGAPPLPAAEPAPFKDDGREHFTATFPGGAVTPSGKNACVTCGEAWPCSADLRRRGEPPTALEADALKRVDRARRLVHELTESGRLTAGDADKLLTIFNSPAVERST